MFAGNLLAFRLAKGWSQEQLEIEIPITGGQVARWEAGRRPRPETIKKIAKALGVTEADLDREPTTRTTTADDEYTFRPSALVILAKVPRFEPVLDAVRVYRAKGDEDPDVKGWIQIADELLELLTEAAGEGIGDVVPDVSKERMQELAKRRSRRA